MSRLNQIEQESVLTAQPLIKPTYPISEYINELGGKRYTVYIYDEIVEVSEFTEMIDVLDNATEDDTITFKVNSPGGYQHSVLALLDAINATKANTIAECSGTVASAATFIALGCDGLYVAPHTGFMFHNYTSGTYGKGHEQLADVLFSAKNNEKFIRAYYEGFLKEKEIKRLLNGEDIYMSDLEVKERYEGLLAIRQADYDEQERQETEKNYNEMVALLVDRGYVITAPTE